MKKSPPSSNLISLFRTAPVFLSKSSPPPPASLVSSSEKTHLEPAASSRDTPSPSPSSSSSSATSVCPGSLLRIYSKKSSKLSSRSKKSSAKRTGDLRVSKLNLGDSNKLGTFQAIFVNRVSLCGDLS